MSIKTVIVVGAFLLLTLGFITFCHAEKRHAATIDEIRALSTSAKNKLPIVYAPQYNISFWGL